MAEWLSRNLVGEWSAARLVGSLTLLAATTVATVVIAGAAIVRLPADYFVGGMPATQPAGGRRRTSHWSVRVLKNLAGVGLILLGAVLSIPGVPGQGLLTVLAGLLLVDLPGKRRAEKWLIARRGIRAAIDRLRAHYGRPPIEFGPIRPSGTGTGPDSPPSV